mmetsp:Transcript_33856/g.95857  ORF Transcript_33856/g.95857 Transcript_33856/m.95857 type:complete len:117 (-) Transcript_33856:625-975(-)
MRAATTGNACHDANCTDVSPLEGLLRHVLAELIRQALVQQEFQSGRGASQSPAQQHVQQRLLLHNPHILSFPLKSPLFRLLLRCSSRDRSIPTAFTEPPHYHITDAEIMQSHQACS